MISELFRYRIADHYWLVATRPGEVYHSARFTYVNAASDAAYLAWVAADFPPTAIATEAELRERLNAGGVAYLAEPLPPIEESRTRVHPVRCRLRRTAQSIAGTGVGAAIQWATGFDPLGLNNPGGANPDRIVIPAGQDGLYMFAASVAFAASAAGTRALQVRRGAVSLGDDTRGAAPTGITHANLTKPAPLSGGDIVRLAVSQDSGAALLVDAELSLWRVE